MELVSAQLFDQYDGTLPPVSLHQYQRSLHHLQRKDQLTKTRNASRKNFERNLYFLKENGWTGPKIKHVQRPNIQASCNECCSQSRNAIPLSPDLPVVDVFRIETYDKGVRHGIFSYFPLLKHCLSFKKHNFPYIFDSVLSEESLKEVIIQYGREEAAEHGITDEEGINLFIEKQRKRAVTILKSMHSKLSDTFLRVVSWLFYRTLPLLFSSMAIPKGQLEMLKKASTSGVPLVFLPLHRSHVDYLAVTFVLCNNGIKSPLVASGENLHIPFFGWLIRRLGAFFIKRRIDPVTGKKDKVYRAVLYHYMTHCLQAGHYFEFFIEGGRSRTGKPCMPKGGLMSVFVDAYLSGILEDALLVPVSINYDKQVEAFTSELTGEPKKPETFSSTIKGIWKSLFTQHGLMRVDFNQPFSLHELVKSFQAKIINNGGTFHLTSSTASLYGTDVVNEDQRQLVDSITRHILYDCSQSTAVMSTNALSFLLLHCYRDGASLSDLTFALDQLRTELALAKKDTGFTGESKDVIEHAANLMGPGLVKIEKKESDIFMTPITAIPNVLELMYYSNTLISHFCIEGVVGRTLLCLTAEHQNSKVSLDRILEVTTSLCEILQFEFVFSKSCQVLNNVIFDCLDKMATCDIINKVEIASSRRIGGFAATLELLDDDEDEYVPPSPLYQVNRGDSRLKLYGTLLEPLIDVYSLVLSHLPKLVGQVLPERILHKELLALIREQIDKGILKYGESLNVETVKNSLKLLEKWGVLECHHEGGTKLVYLSTYYEGPDALASVASRIDLFRHSDLSHTNNLQSSSTS